MTNTWMDIKNADVMIVMGGNAAEAHPVGFKWVIEAKVKKKAKLIVVDPRFTRTASVADLYCPIRPGTDIAFLSGVAKYLLDNDKIQHEYVRSYTNAAYIVRDGFAFNDGLFTGYDVDKRGYDTSSWEYEIGGRRLRRDGSDDAASALRHAVAEAACRRLHARTGRAHHRLAKRQVSQSLRR